MSRQVAIVEEMVAAGVDAIVIAPADSKALVPVLRRAKEAGVVVVNIDNRLDADVLKQEGIIAVLQTGLAQLGVSDANKQIITSSVIVAAALIDALRARRRFRVGKE